MERQISLLYLATVPAPLRNFYIPYARHFRDLGWRVSAAANGATAMPGLREAFDAVYDVPVSRSLKRADAHFAAYRGIARLFGTGFDLVHVHTPIAAFIARMAARTAPADARPGVVYTAHGFHFHHDGRALPNLLYREAERLAGRWTDRLVVINAEDWQAARDEALVPPARLVRMPGVGIDTSWYSRRAVPLDAQATLRERLGIGLESPLFLVIGELHPNKRQSDAIDAIACLRHRSAHLALVGEGRDRRRLEGHVRELGLERRVHLVGFVEDVRPWVATAAAVLLPSTREGLSRSVMEALAMETPVIASTARGNRELVGEDAGIVVPTGDVLAFAAAMDGLLDDPNAAAAMGRAGRLRMTGSYELGPVIERHERMYLAMLDERARSGG